MKKKNGRGKIAIIFCATLLALMGIATGYAMWSQDLVVEGYVDSGTLDWKFVELLTVEDTSCGPPFVGLGVTPDYNCDPNHGFEEYEGGIVYGWGPTQDYLDPKDVACGSLTVTDDHTLTITINNAYPGYWNGVQTHVKCIGTIPIKIQAVYLCYDEEGTDIIATIGQANRGEIFDIDLDKDGNIDMEFLWGEDFGHQMEFFTSKREISFEFCFLQPLPENMENLDLYVKLRACQWNEYFDPTG